MSLFAFLVVGGVAGLVARALVPGRQSMGLFATTILGIVGSFIGGVLGSAIYSDGNFLTIQPSGLIFAILGAIAVLAAGNLSNSRRARV